MSNLSWKDILKSQQQDFIERFKSRIWADIDLSYAVYEEPSYSLSCFSEVIKIKLEGVENCLTEFSHLMMEKFYPDYPKYFGDEQYIEYLDIRTSHKIGKIGEEAVSMCLGSVVKPVDYNFYGRGDGGVDLHLQKDHSIGIQVKTRVLSRITEKEVYKNNLDDHLRHEIGFDRFFNAVQSVDSLQWKIKPHEIEKNKVLVCVLLLNFVNGHSFGSKGYECTIAGFIPTEDISDSGTVQFKDLLYAGGLRGYLESLLL